MRPIVMAGLAGAALLLLSSSAKAKLPPLPKPLPRIVPKPSQAAHAAAAASAAAMASAPLSRGPMSSPASAPTHTVVSPVASPTPNASTPVPPSDGFDAVAARRGARSLAAHLQRSGRSNYDHRLLKQWQKLAGLVPDGIYGGAARGALLHFGALNPPAPFFPPLMTVPYQLPR
jgi:hypothetical protein